jgi:hypothetical protein
MKYNGSHSVERRQAPRMQTQHDNFANLIYLGASEQLLINVNSVFVPTIHWTGQLQTTFKTFPSRKFCVYVFMFLCYRLRATFPPKIIMMMTTTNTTMMMTMRMMMMMMIMTIIIINVRAVNDFLFLGVGFYRAKILASSLCVLTLDTLLMLDF